MSIESWWDGNVSGRSADILQLVLAAISEDYSNLGMILESINELDSSLGPEAWPARKAVPVNRQEVIHALEELTREGFAQAYRLETGNAEQVRFSAESARNLWFCATPKGSDAVRKLLENVANSKDQ